MVRIWLLCLLSASLVAAQSPWQGEWGSYREVKGKGDVVRADGQRLSIQSCVGSACQALITTSDANGEHCDGSGQLKIDSDTKATLTIPAVTSKKTPCRLILQRSPSSIAVQPESAADCKDFCTPKCTFNRSFPSRSRTVFYGDDIPGCYLQRSKATMAVCTDNSLAALEVAWRDLNAATGQLMGQKVNTIQLRDQAFTKCSQSEDAGACLRALFEQDSQRLRRQKAQWQESMARAGDPKEAEQKVQQIAGNYQHTFQNGDVQGDSYKATNKLTITPGGAGQINFHLYTSFFNGHSCEVAGQARYRAIGAFVFESNENGEKCDLQVWARPNEVEFRDPTGACRLYYCGARGGLDATRFPYTEKSSAH